MAVIKPFKGIVYNSDRISDLKEVTTPPYDVITKEEQDNFYKMSEYNVIRLILGKESELDNLGDNRYTRAAAFFSDWQKEKILTEDEKDSIYVYQQEYFLDKNVRKTRTGFIALTKIEEFSTGTILPHEKTLSGPKSDRLKLMESCHCNFSQIFSLYSDSELKIDKVLNESISGRDPDMLVRDNADVVHRLFKVTDENTISRVIDLIKDKSLFIADGHHRYETALNFKRMNEKNGSLPEESPYNYVMMYCSNMDSDGLNVFPTHRVLFNLLDYQLDFLRDEVGRFFSVTDLPFNDENEPEALEELIRRLKEEGEKKHAFGMYIKGDKALKLLVLEDPEKIGHILKDDMAESLKKLDVTILHSVIIDHLLGVGTAAQEKQENLKYVKGGEKAIALVKDGDYQVAFILNPTKIDQVKEVASSGNKMPQKSTFFYPKLLTGLVINKLD